MQWTQRRTMYECLLTSRARTHTNAWSEEMEKGSYCEIQGNGTAVSNRTIIIMLLQVECMLCRAHTKLLRNETGKMAMQFASLSLCFSTRCVFFSCALLLPVFAGDAHLTAQIFDSISAVLFFLRFFVSPIFRWHFSSRLLFSVAFCLRCFCFVLISLSIHSFYTRPIECLDILLLSFPKSLLASQFCFICHLLVLFWLSIECKAFNELKQLKQTARAFDSCTWKVLNHIRF